MKPFEQARAPKPAVARRLVAAVAAPAIVLCATFVSSAAEISEVATAAPSRRLTLASESRLWIEGDSTLHAYASTATRIDLVAAIALPVMEGHAMFDVLKNAKADGFKLAIPVRSLKSGKAGLDKNMRRALKSEQHAEIVFTLDALDLTAPPVAGALLVKATGRLNVAGKDKAIDLEAQVIPHGEKVRVWGREDLLMTDFGIKPPAMLLGTLKTDDRVVVHFDLVLVIGDEAEAQTRRNQP
jgi:polyisoprenoid-binding protein YceI